eukprot:jgi/Botrbrau1/21981/Bobra.0565s0001.1
MNKAAEQVRGNFENSNLEISARICLIRFAPVAWRTFVDGNKSLIKDLIGRLEPVWPFADCRML